MHVGMSHLATIISGVDGPPVRHDEGLLLAHTAQGVVLDTDSLTAGINSHLHSVAHPTQYDT